MTLYWLNDCTAADADCTAVGYFNIAFLFFPSEQWQVLCTLIVEISVWHTRNERYMTSRMNLSSFLTVSVQQWRLLTANLQPLMNVTSLSHWCWQYLFSSAKKYSLLFLWYDDSTLFSSANATTPISLAISIHVNSASDLSNLWGHVATARYVV